MARIDDLLEEIPDTTVRAHIRREVERIRKATRFGLNFERHLPETAVLTDVDVAPGDQVRKRSEADTEQTWRVASVQDGAATVVSPDGETTEQVRKEDLCVVRGFAEAVFPGLELVDEIRRSDDRPSHAVICGENFHALTLMHFMYEGQVDCIYIDPPYNSGAADWKYNNRYVDSTDRWRHSKWLSYMERRLKLAQRLLKDDGVLIVTIDENEVSHLGVLLEDVFPGYLRHMVTIVINPKGTAKANFARVEEYAYFVVPDVGREVIAHLPPPDDTPETDFDSVEYAEGDDLDPDDMEAEPADEEESVPESRQTQKAAEAADYSVLYLRRRGAESSARTDRPRQFYAIYVDEKARKVTGIGPELKLGDPWKVTRKRGVVSIFPIDSEGNERTWRYGRDTMERLIAAGDIRVGSYIAARDTWVLNHWKPREGPRVQRVRTVWWRTAHDAGTHGSTLISRLLGRRNAFPFPKSVYAVRDCLDAVVRDRPNALILDFFAGSGTTLHATAMLNRQDGGRRRCVLVTNNEVDQKLTEHLNGEGLYRGDEAFEQHGIFWSATRPRITTALTGRRPDGSTPARDAKHRYLDGSYFADGFEENCAFFVLRYLDPLRVELGHEFDAIHPTLWMKAGARGPLPTGIAHHDEWAILPQAGYAILFDEDALRDFQDALRAEPAIRHLYLVTDSPESYAEMRQHLGLRYTTSMLYGDYIHNVRIDPQRPS